MVPDLNQYSPISGKSALVQPVFGILPGWRKSAVSLGLSGFLLLPSQPGECCLALPVLEVADLGSGEVVGDPPQYRKEAAVGNGGDASDPSVVVPCKPQVRKQAAEVFPDGEGSASISTPERRWRHGGCLPD